MFYFVRVSSRIKRKAVKVPTITSRTKFSDTARDALEGGVKYSPLILAVAGAVSVLAGVILEFSSLQAQITLAGEKLKTIESSTGEKLKSIESSTGEKLKSIESSAGEKLKSVESLYEKLMNEKIKSIESSIGEKIKSIESSTGEKINASVDKSVRIALEDFLKYSYSSEFEGMREKKDREVIGKESDSSKR